MTGKNFFFFFFKAIPAAYGGSQARDQISYSCQPTPQSQQLRIQAASVTYTTAHGNAGSSTQLSKARDQTHNLMVTGQIRFHCATMGIPRNFLKQILCDLGRGKRTLISFGDGSHRMGFGESGGFGQDRGGAWSTQRHPEILGENCLKQTMHVRRNKREARESGWHLTEKHMNPRIQGKTRV